MKIYWLITAIVYSIIIYIWHVYKVRDIDEDWHRIPIPVIVFITNILTCWIPILNIFTLYLSMLLIIKCNNWPNHKWVLPKWLSTLLVTKIK